MPVEGQGQTPILYMEELFKDKQFHTYQTRLAVMMHNYVNGLMLAGKMDQAYGALELARRVINHPATIRPDDPQIAQKVEAGKKRFQTNFIISNGQIPEE